MLQSLRFISVTICSVLIAVIALSQSTHPLFAAIRKNDAKQLKELLNKPGTNLDIVDDDSDNVLMCAATYANADIMELLLKKGAKIDGRNRAGETALMWCVHDKNQAELLLTHGADVNAKASSGNTPFLIACVGYGNYEIIKTLLANGADPSVTNNKKETALMRAALFADTAVISLLVNRGIDINAKNGDGETALVYAIQNSNREAVFQLLKLGADPDVAVGVFPSALCMAVIYDDMEIVRAILKKTRNKNAIAASVLFAVYNEHDNSGIIQELIEKGGAVNMRAPDGSTVLSWALKKGNTTTVDLLKSAGAK